MKMLHLDYEIDKEHWQNIFWDHLDMGKWHWGCASKRKLWWWQIMIGHNHPIKKYTAKVEKELNIFGLNNYPRFSYTLPNAKISHHKDKDNMVTININLMPNKPIIHVDHKPYPYEIIYIHVGELAHGIEPDPNPRLILKFCMRHTWEEVYERLDRFGLIKEEQCILEN